MTSLKMLALGALMLVAMCMAQDVHTSLLIRPARPDAFNSEQEVRDYVQKLKAFLDKGANRYGKRTLSPIQTPRKMLEEHEQSEDQTEYKEYAEPSWQSHYKPYYPVWLKQAALKAYKGAY